MAFRLLCCAWRCIRPELCVPVRLLFPDKALCISHGSALLFSVITMAELDARQQVLAHTAKPDFGLAVGDKRLLSANNLPTRACF